MAITDPAQNRSILDPEKKETDGLKKIENVNDGNPQEENDPYADFQPIDFSLAVDANTPAPVLDPEFEGFQPLDFSLLEPERVEDLETPQVKIDRINNLAGRLSKQHGLYATSTARTPEDNERVGGSDTSFHLLERGHLAIDFAAANDDPEKKKKEIEFYEKMKDRPEVQEIIDEGDHIHVAFKESYVLAQNMAEDVFPPNEVKKKIEKDGFDWLAPWINGAENITEGIADVLVSFTNPLELVEDAVGEELDFVISEKVDTYVRNLIHRRDVNDDVVIETLKDINTESVYKALGENVPTMAAYMLLARRFGPVGSIAIGVLQHQGEAIREMRAYEKATGEKLPAWKKLVMPAVVGAVNGTMEMLSAGNLMKGLKTPLKGAVKKKLVDLFIGSSIEGLTEGSQYIVSELGKLAYDEGVVIDEKTFHEAKANFYTGFIVSLATAGAMEVYASNVHTREAKEFDPTDQTNISAKRSLIERFIETSDTRYAYGKMNAPETGNTVTTSASYIEAFHEYSQSVVKKAANFLGKDQKNLSRAYHAAENVDYYNSLRLLGETEIIEAADVIREYFDSAEKELKAQGVIQDGLLDRLKTEANTEMQGLQKKTQELVIDRAKAQVELQSKQISQKKFDKIQKRIKKQEMKLKDDFASYQRLLDKLDKTKFVHIPGYLFKNDIKEKQRFKGSLSVQKMIKFFNAEKRDTITMQDMINAGILDGPDSIDVAKAMQSYAERTGRDLALARIKNSAIQEKMAISVEDKNFKSGKYGSSYVIPPKTAKVFSGLAVTRPLAEHLEYITHTGALDNWFRRGLNFSKALGFANPLIMPMYNLVQGVMATGVQALNPFRIYKAVQHVNEFSELYIELKKNGLTSTPYPAPFHETEAKYQKAAFGWLQAMKERHNKDTSKKKIASAAKHLLLGAYEVSWNTTWYLDSINRTATALWNLEKKTVHGDPELATPEEIAKAARFAAKTHADYASVPMKTRRQLNTVFYTPTFQISMGKLLTQTLRGVGDSIRGKETEAKAHAGVWVATMGLLIGFDAFMLSLGFDRDRFGRRYVREGFDRYGIPREIVFTWSSPANMAIKYYENLAAATEPTSFNAFETIGRRVSWMLHPAYTTFWESLKGVGSDGREIYGELDPPEVKAWQVARYFTTEIATMAHQLGDHQMERAGKLALAKQVGGAEAILLNFLGFVYTRDLKDIRRKEQAERLIGVMKEALGSNLARKILSGDVTEEDYKEYSKYRTERIKDFNNRVDELIKDWTKEYYSFENAMEGLKDLDTLGAYNTPNDFVPFGTIE